MYRFDQENYDLFGYSDQNINILRHACILTFNEVVVSPIMSKVSKRIRFPEGRGEN